MESGKKALIFSRFVNKEYGIARIKQCLPESYGIVEMHGSIPQAERDRNVDLFNGNSEAKLFLLSYRVGNAGLNLQAANYVFLFDRWWNPAVEEQATKRAHRIGQKNKVFVRRLYCKDTIEERILRKLNEKRRLFAMVIDDANPCAADLGLTEEELFSLFGDLKARPKHVRRVVEKPRIVLDELDSKQFENLVAVLYERLGYSVSVSGGPGDRGTDVLAEKSSATGGERISIQCKHTKSTVGQPVVQHLWGALNSDDSLTRGVIVSSSTFSADAKSFVAGIRITLIDRKKLIELLMEFGVVDLVDDR
ncbi:MAG: restriction endonuclease [Planctomycetes bacterium]|nr:restriction endonuclease [Planctomycetota bacterium]